MGRVRRSVPVLILHLDDNGPYDALRSLLEEEGYLYQQVRNPTHLLRAFSISVTPRDCAQGNPESGARRLRALIGRAKRIVVILDEHLESGVAAKRRLFRANMTGSEVAHQLAPLGIDYLRYSGCYENDWNESEQGQGVVYKDDRGPDDARSILALVRELLAKH